VRRYSARRREGLVFAAAHQLLLVGSKNRGRRVVDRHPLRPLRIVEDPHRLLVGSAQRGEVCVSETTLCWQRQRAAKSLGSPCPCPSGPGMARLGRTLVEGSLQSRRSCTIPGFPQQESDSPTLIATNHSDDFHAEMPLKSPYLTCVAETLQNAPHWAAPGLSEAACSGRSE